MAANLSQTTDKPHASSTRTPRRRFSVRIKLIGLIFGLFLVVAAINTWLGFRNALQRVETQTTQDLLALQEIYDAEVLVQEEQSASLAIAIADRKDVKELFVNRDREELLDLLTPLFDTLKSEYSIVHLYVHEPDGVVFVRIHNPEKYGDDIKYRRTAAAAVTGRETIAGVEIGPGRLGVRGVTPLLQDGEYIGLVEVGLDYDEAFVQNLKDQTGADYRMWVTYDASAPAGLEPQEGVPPSPLPEQIYYYASTFTTQPEVSPALYQQVLNSGDSQVVFLTDEANLPRAVLVSPLRAYQGRIIGIIEISINYQDALAAYGSEQLNILAVSTLTAVLMAALFGVLTSIIVLRPLRALSEVAERQIGGDMTARAQVTTRDEFEQLGYSLNVLSDQVAQSLAKLEQRVAERTQSLIASSQVSSSVSKILDPEQLVREIVTQVQEAFNYYHVQIYLFDKAKENLIMVSGTGEAGAVMLANKHRVARGQGLVGRAGASNMPVFVPDVSQDAGWLPNPLLADTGAEAAIPIGIGDLVLGVLDVQHDKIGVLNQEQVDLLQSIGGQLAVALQNARQVEQTIETQRRFELAVAGTNDGIWEWDIPGNEVYFSPRWKAMIGHEDQEITSNFDEYESRIHPEDHDRIMGAIRDYLAGRSDNYEHELRLRHKDGSYRWILVRATLERDAQGNPLRMAGSHSDITARKRSEAELRAAQERTQTILESVTIPMLISRLSDGRMHYVNQYLAELVQMPLEELRGAGSTPDFYVDIADRETVVRQIRQRGAVNNYELRLKRTNGEQFWALLSARLINFAGELAIITSLIDITDRKGAEQQIQEEQQRVRVILESINVPLVISKISDGIVAYVNEPMARVIRESREALQGQVTPDFYQNPADRQTYLAALRQDGYIDNFEAGLERSDGERFWALLSGRIFNYQGEPAIITSLVDITERRTVQAALAQRAAEMETVADLGTVAATILEPETLLLQVVEMTKIRFSLYHAHIYQVDESGKTLVLTHGAGDVGREMVAKGHKFPMAQQQSLVTRAARSKEGVIINDVQAEPGFLPNPLLPHTRAEMAVPLIAGNQVLGVLDVQDTEENRFSVEDINIFTTLATQVAVALQNARRYDEAQRALDDLSRMQRVMAREGWQAFLLAQDRPLRGYYFDQKDARPIHTNGEKAGSPLDTTSMQENGFAIPLSIRGETIGRIGLRNPDNSPIPPQKQALLTTITQQVAEALERARLAEQTQLALSEAETLSQVGAQLNSAETFQDINKAVTSILSGRSGKPISGTLMKIEVDEHGQPETLVVLVSGRTDRLDSGPMRWPIRQTNPNPAWLANGGELVLIDNAESDPRLSPVEVHLYREQGIHSLAILPLQLGDSWVGLYILSTEQPVTFTQSDERLYAAITDQVAVAVNSLQLLSSAQQRAQREQMLREITERVNTAPDANAILRTAAQEVGRAFGLETYVYLADPTSDTEEPAQETNGADTGVTAH